LAAALWRQWGTKRAVDQGPDRANSFKSEKKRAKRRRLSYCFTRRQTAPFPEQYNTNLVNLKGARRRSTSLFAPQHATF
jgi:hypothetical protein